MTNTMIVCGLTEWEQETVRKHKGECKHCMHWDTIGTADDFTPVCSEGHKIDEQLRTDCKDWFLDTR